MRRGGGSRCIPCLCVDGSFPSLFLFTNSFLFFRISHSFTADAFVELPLEHLSLSLYSISPLLLLSAAKPRRSEDNCASPFYILNQCEGALFGASFLNAPPFFDIELLKTAFAHHFPRASARRIDFSAADWLRTDGFVAARLLLSLDSLFCLLASRRNYSHLSSTKSHSRRA